jgi:predicted Zn-dependent peptidase
VVAASGARSTDGAVRTALVYVRRSSEAGPFLIPFGEYDDWSLRDRYNEAIRIMNEALGGLFSSRINLNLREQHGYTYGAFSTFQYRRGVGPFLTGGAIRTDATAPAAAEVFKELNAQLRKQAATT